MSGSFAGVPVPGELYIIWITLVVIFLVLVCHVARHWNDKD